MPINHAVPRAPLGRSDQSMVYLIPTYMQKLKSDKPLRTTVKKWTQEAILSLQGCFDCFDWAMFSESCAHQGEYADTVTSYVSFCTDSCIPSKMSQSMQMTNPGSQRTSNTNSLQNNDAFKNSDKNQYKAAKDEAEKAIRRAKAQYRNKLEKQFSTSNSHAVWQITQYKQKPTPANNDPTLPDQLNHFYSRFHRKNTTKASGHSGPMQAVPPDSDSGLPPPPFTVRPWEVKNLFIKLNIRKAAGPDNILSLIHI